MLCGDKIKSVTAAEIIDSRGNPTVEATVVLEDSSIGIASVPSGASTGKYEALELRDPDKSRYMGKGVLKACENVNEKISKVLVGMVCNQRMVDSLMIRHDGTMDKSCFGANAMLSVSIAAARAGARHTGVPLYRYIGGVNVRRLPIPMMNILNGGAHAGNNLDIQEFMIVPSGFDRFSEALRAGCEIYHALGKILKSNGKSTSVGDEGGYAPDLSGENEALDYIMKAIKTAGYSEKEVQIALDCAASEWADGDGHYKLSKKGEQLTRDELISKLEKLSDGYPIISIEDGMGEDDTEGWKHLTKRLGSRMNLVGDDLFVTNPTRLKHGIRDGCANSILIKPNQIGTLSETLDAVRIAAGASYTYILSHRSGDTADSAIADIAVGVGSEYIKTGAPCRGERCAKYNRLLRIERELGSSAVYGAN